MDSDISGRNSCLNTKKSVQMSEGQWAMLPESKLNPLHYSSSLISQFLHSTEEEEVAKSNRPLEWSNHRSSSELRVIA